MPKSKKPVAGKSTQARPQSRAVKAKPNNGMKAQPEAAVAQAETPPAPEQAPAKKKAKSAAQPQAKSETVKAKPKKAKLVRDSFTMPENEYQVIGELKKACIGAGFSIKKSELLRIGVALLQKMTPAQIQKSLAALPALKAGRPKKEEGARASA